VPLLLGIAILAFVLVSHQKLIRPVPVPAGPLPRYVLRETDSPYIVALSQNGAVIAVGQASNDTYNPRKRQPVPTMVYDARTGAPLQEISVNYRADAIALSPDGRTIALQTFPGDITTRDVRTGHILHKINAFAYYMAFSPNGRMLATSGPGTQIWDAATGRLLRTLISPRKPRPADDYPAGCNVAFSPDSKLLAYASDFRAPVREQSPSQERGEQPQLWDVATGKLVRTLPGMFTAALAFSHDGRSLLCVQDKQHGQENQIVLRRVNVRTGQVEWSLPHDEMEWAINSLAASPKSTALACQNGNHEVFMVSEKTGALLQKLVPPNADPRKDASWSNHSGLGFSGDGRTLVSRGGGGNTVSVWDVSAFR